MSEQPQHSNEADRAAEASDFGQLLQFPGAPKPTAPETTPEPGDEDTADSGGVDGPSTDLDTSDQERAPERLADAPHRAPHIPESLRRAGTRTWDVSKRAGRASLPVAKTGARHGYYLTAGAWDTIAVPYSRMTGRDIDARIDAAQAAGDHGTAAQLLAQRTESRKILIERIKLFGKFLKHSPKIAGGLLLVSLATVSIVSVVAFVRPGGMTAADVWNGTITALVTGWEWIAWLGTTVVPWTVAALAAGLLITGYNRRRRLGVAPEWVAPAEPETSGEQVIPFSADNLIRALADLEIAKLSASIKAGWPNREGEHPWFKAPRQDGPGMAASIRLPGGVEVEKIQKKQVTLAHNLGCVSAELQVNRNPKDGTVLDLYRLDKGELRRPAPEYPLLHEGSTDFFKGVPVGVTPFGKKITAHLFERNYVVSGRMGSGKTVLIQDILAGASLDPLVDLEVICFAANADYSGMDPVLDRRIQGNPLEVADEAEARFAELQDDLVKRGELFERLGPGTTLNRELAAKHPELRPRIVVMDECQWFFRQDKPDDKRRMINAVLNYITTARKYGIVLILATPTPSDQSLPRDIVSVTSNNACGAINDKRRNNVVLGENAHENGISAIGLVPRDPETGELNDTGTLITTGFTSADSETLRTHYLDPQDMATVVERATALRGGPVEQKPAPVPENRDLLEDLDAVLGTERVRLADVPGRLRELAPQWREYREMTGQSLGKTLRGLGVPTPKPNNVPSLDPESVRTARAAQRDTDEPDSSE